MAHDAEPAPPAQPGFHRGRAFTIVTTAVTQAHPHQIGAAPTQGAFARRFGANVVRGIQTVTRPPQARPPRVRAMAMVVALLTIAAAIAAMFLLDTKASAWALNLPRWFVDAFQTITKLGLSGWFLYPLGVMLLALAAVMSPALPRLTEGVLAALAVRFGFLFVAIGAPGLFVTIIKRLIGRARPLVGGHDDPFLYVPFIWRPAYAAMPSGHATTAVSAAIAIGAIWPPTRWVMWLYALLILLSRVVVLAHHPSDVIAGGLVGAVGALMVRRYFAARRLGFCPRDLKPYSWPSFDRIRAAARHVMRGT
jgi:membrane-associated phospholipid phosphatase